MFTITGITPYERFHGQKPDLSHLYVWRCQCFILILPELRSKGGPHRFEEIFVGYDDDRVGWYVCDKKTVVHFSQDVVFNESVSGHLSPTHHVTSSSSSSPFSSASTSTSSTSSSSSLPVVHLRVRTVAGQAFAETIAARDHALVLCCSCAPAYESACPPLSLSVIQDFLSLADIAALPSPIPTWSLIDEASSVISSFCLHSYADPTRYLHTSHFDLSKPPESYHEACARPDVDVWRAVCCYGS